MVKRAVASGRYYREIYVATPVGERVLEGFVDLCFVEDDALVIVDFKTDAISEEGGASVARRYRTQVGAYALALARSTGMPVKEAVLLFLQRDPMPEVFRGHGSPLGRSRGGRAGGKLMTTIGPVVSC